jgi:hypothetical protein
MPRAEFQFRDPSNQAAADLRLRPRGHWDGRSATGEKILLEMYQF